MLMIALMLAAADPASMPCTASLPNGQSPCVLMLRSSDGRIVGPDNPLLMEACGGDINRPDVVVCVASPDHSVRLVLPDPPCGTPEAAKAERCTPWKIGPTRDD